MPQYRLYILDADGHIKRRIDLDCRDDGEAIERAIEHEIGTGMDLWCDARRVRMFSPPGSPSSRRVAPVGAAERSGR